MLMRGMMIIVMIIINTRSAQAARMANSTRFDDHDITFIQKQSFSLHQNDLEEVLYPYCPYHRFSPADWSASNIDHYNGADASRNNSERVPAYSHHCHIPCFVLVVVVKVTILSILRQNSELIYSGDKTSVIIIPQKG